MILKYDYSTFYYKIIFFLAYKYQSLTLNVYDQILLKLQ